MLSPSAGLMASDSSAAGELGSEVNQMCWVGHMVERLMKQNPAE